MATNFNVDGASDFTNADPKELLFHEILKGIGTKDHYSFKTGVKNSTIIPYISNTDLDVSCGVASGYRTGTGQSTVLDVTLSNTVMNIFETYQKSAVDQKVLGLLSPGTDPSDLPAKKIIQDLKEDQLFLKNEYYIWQADTSTIVQTSGKAPDIKFDGVLAQLRGGVAGTGIAAVALSSLPSDASVRNHVLSLVDEMITEIPSLVTKETVISMSPPNFCVWNRAQWGLNGLITKDTIIGDSSAPQESYIPGTKVKVVSEPGLLNKNDMVLTTPKNIIAVYDLESESEKMDFIFNPWQNWHQLSAEWKIGVQVVDVSLCIKTG